MPMLIPSRQNPPLRAASQKPTRSPLTPFTARTAVIITFAVGLILLIDQYLETRFIASPIVEVDKSSKQITTEEVTFLPEFHDVAGVEMTPGHLLILEVSPITKTVVAYKPPDDILVKVPRESIFNYWPVTLIMTMVSLFLLIRWNHMQRNFELLIVNLILLIIITILYVISH